MASGDGGGNAGGRAVPLAGRLRRFGADHWQLLLLAAIMAGAFFLRLHYLSRHTEYTADSYYFLILARSIKETFSYTVRGIAHTKYLPGFPIFIWSGSYIFGSLETAANMVAVLGGTLTILATYGLGRELFNKWAGLLAALLVAFQPTFLKWTCLPMTEGLFTFLFAGGLYLVLTGCKRASPPRRVLGAVAGGLCFLVRWEGILFLPLMVLIGVLYIRGSKMKAWEPAVLLFLYGLPMGVYIVRNLIVTGKVSHYFGEYRQYDQGTTFKVFWNRLRVYGWEGMSDALYSAFFYAGCVYMLVRKKWKPFLISAGWFALFLGFHMFWYYAYERFMAPAAPAVALVIGFMVFDLGALAYRALRRGGPADRYLPTRVSERNSRVVRSAAMVLVVLLLAGSVGVLVVHGLYNADSAIERNYEAFADDHGGKGMAQAADWLRENAPGAAVAVDAGPYFQWEYPGEVLYLRPVPWDLPVEDKDVEYRNVPDQLLARGVRYIVIGQTEKGVEDELTIFGITGDETDRLREVARWENRYDYPEPHELTTVIFEVLPPS